MTEKLEMSKDLLEIKTGVSKYVPRRVETFCFTKLARSCGFSASNKAHSWEDLLNFCKQNLIDLVVDDGYEQDVITCGVDDQIPWKLRVSPDHKHAIKLDHFIPVPLSFQLKKDDFDLQKKKKKKGEVINKQMDEETRKALQKVDHEVIEIRSKMRMQPKSIPKDVTRAAPRRSAMFAQYLNFFCDPSPLKSHMLFPDPFSKRVATHCATTNLDLSGINHIVGSLNKATYIAIIHSAFFSSHYLTPTAFFPKALRFYICSLRIREASDLQDSVISSTGDQGAIESITLANTITALPLHSATVTYLDNTTYLYSPSETYDSTLNLFPISIFPPSLPVNQGFAIISGEYIDFEFTARAAVGAILQFHVTFYNTVGTPVTQTVSYVVPITGPSVVDSVSIIFSASGTLANVTYECDNNIVITSLGVAISASSGGISTTTLLITPFSRWTSTSVPNYTDLVNATEEQRCVASSILLSNISNEFVAQGSLYGGLVTSGNCPAETGVCGVRSAGKAHNFINTPEKNGMYLAPWKMARQKDRDFIDLDTPWSGQRPYAVVFAQVPPQNINGVINTMLKVSMVDRYELRMEEEQQLKDLVSYGHTDQVLCDRFADAFSESSGILAENPLHWDDIRRFISGAVKHAPMVTDILEKVGETTGNPYIQGAAKGVRGATGLARMFGL